MWVASVDKTNRAITARYPSEPYRQGRHYGRARPTSIRYLLLLPAA